MTMVDSDPNTHKALVCVICDAIFIGTEHKCYLSFVMPYLLELSTNATLARNKSSSTGAGSEFSVSRKNRGLLDPLLVEQYHVDGFLYCFCRQDILKRGKFFWVDLAVIPDCAITITT